ncbi:MAG: hypothetical protein ONB05_02130 [candidate division KSB1 bacterium]|nr:hypothetical protein [candidate division KSB1 bacterium]
MEVNEIRALVTQRPFRPFEIHLDNGETHLITHPEIIITEYIIAAVDKKGKLVLIAPEAVSSIRVLAEAKR